MPLWASMEENSERHGHPVYKKLHSSNQQTDTSHDRVTERCAEGNHDEPDSHVAQLADYSFVLD